MPNLDAAKKAVRQSEKRRIVNDRRRRAMRETVKVVRESAKTQTPVTQESLSKAFQALDKAAKRGVIKKGTADRKKSRLSKIVAAVAAK